MEPPEELWIYHNPKNKLFMRDGHSDPRAVQLGDSDLVKSFIHSCQDNRNHLDNAGAVALYKVGGSKITEVHEAISHRIIKDSTYGHTERKLMRLVLDELLSANLADQSNLQGPSSRFTPLNEEQNEFQILKNLADPKNAKEYKSYLEENGIIVKMWTERLPCDYRLQGGTCEDFLRNICPKGSEIRHIVKKPGPSEAEVRAAFTDLENAYQQFLASEQDKTRRIN